MRGYGICAYGDTNVYFLNSIWSQVLQYIKIIFAWKINKVMVNIPLYELYECHVLSRSFPYVDIYARSQIIDPDFVGLMSDNGIKICICPRLLHFMNGTSSNFPFYVFFYFAI